MFNVDNEYTRDVDAACPQCGHTPTRALDCDQCEDGQVELSDDMDGYEDYRPCEHCAGHGSLHWCPACDADLHAPEWIDKVVWEEDPWLA